MKPFFFGTLLIVILSTQISHARLTSLSAINTVDVDGQSVQQVIASCGTKKHKPTLIRIKGERQWCDSVITDICHKDKLEVAQRVCSLSYSNRLKSLDENSLAIIARNDLDKLRKEAMHIEDTLVKIQAARIALRKRELDLVKQRDRDILQAGR